VATILGSLEVAADMLAAGGVVLMPTDTIPGLHCRADAPAAVQRIATLKGRPATKPFLVLGGSTASALELTSPLTREVLDYAHRCWPGPFSLILPAASSVPSAVIGGLDSVAIRVPLWRELCRLIELAGGPLVSTSANRSGEPAGNDLTAAVALFADAVDGIWTPGGEPDYSPAPTANHTDWAPSGLIDLTGWPPRIVREGATAPPAWSAAEE